jgi:hypothetical protein
MLCFEVDHVGRLAVKGRVRPPAIEEFKIADKLRSGFGNALIGMQINMLKFHASPESFDKDVIDPPALAVHADLDFIVLQDLREIVAGELAALIGIENFRRAVSGDRLVQRFETEIRGHADRHSVCEHLARGPVNDRDQVVATNCSQVAGSL